MTVTDRVVIDANVAIGLASRDLLDDLALTLAAPPLMLVECRSALHQMGVRHGTLDYSRILQRRIEAIPLVILDDPRQRDVAWDLANELGWQKTYDAEYLAAAKVHDLPLATHDRRLASAAENVAVRSARMP